MWSLFEKKSSPYRDSSLAKRVYLDYAAATPLLPEVLSAMLPYFHDTFGNAGSIHQEGVVAKRSLEECRTRVARVLGVQDTGIVFTSGGTESNNLAITGYVERLVAGGRAYEGIEIVTTHIEHSATGETMARLARRGVRIVYVPVTDDGVIDVDILESLLTDQTVLVTVSYVNSEVGAITRCRDIRRIIDGYTKKSQTTIALHIDAAQAPLWLPCDLPRLGADLLSLDAGKMNGPKGCGVLAMRKGMQVSAIVGGGGQERGMRPGTEPLPSIVGCTVALELAQHNWQERAARVSTVRDYFLARITDEVPNVIVNGPLGNDRVANNVHISIPGLDAEFAVITLDAQGIAASTKSACSSKGGGASAVVLAMTGDEARATSTLRFTLGPDNTTADIDVAILTLTQHLTNTAQL